MTRFRLILLSMFAVLAVSAIGSASASAAECPDTVEGGDFAFCSESKEIEVATVLSEAASEGKAKLKSEIAGEKITIECEEIKSEDGKLTIEDSGLSKGEIIYEKCVIYNKENKALTKCTIATIPTKFSGELENSGKETKFKQQNEATPFAEITVSGAECAVKVNKAKVTGTQKCTNDDNPTVEEETHELECRAGGSTLKLGTAAAEYTADTILEGPATPEHDAANWSIKGS